jgi:hypothetical protein
LKKFSGRYDGYAFGGGLMISAGFLDMLSNDAEDHFKAGNLWYFREIRGDVF